ncbi:MAG: hypothetical protein HOB51_06855 [Thaumarchaeota archaeon]|jgi:hypothetical protein|nr:hypothetical protein [Nitrososphaerota archaeon]
MKDSARKAMFAKQNVNFDNRAWKGVRIVSDNFKRNDKNVFVTVDTHVTTGKYVVELHNEHQNDRNGLPLDSEKKFNTFNQAKDYVENKYNLNVKLPEHPQATHTWKQNVTYTDYELPYEKVFWSLPEVAKKNHYYQNENVKRESIPEFIQRLQKKKSRWLKGTQYANSHSND